MLNGMKAGLMVMASLMVSATSFAQSGDVTGNTTIQSFAKAKKILLTKVYNTDAMRVTLYCQAHYGADKVVTVPDGFVDTTARKPRQRPYRITWEHVVPAENFGRSFVEWREGAPECERNGRSFKGRKCASKVNETFKRMEADLYNLYPAIDVVNIARQNYPFTQLSKNTPNTFGSCPLKIEDRRVEPPESARGMIARTTLYFAAAYGNHYRLSDAQTKLMNAWNKTYPVSATECHRARLIEAIQKNENPFVKGPCVAANLYR